MTSQINGGDDPLDIVHAKDLEFQHPGLKHRKGAPLFKYLFQGNDDDLDNYNLTLAQQNKFFSPRHRHNFEQFRFPIKGNFSMGTDPEVILHEGELGYFPEGTYYGPQQDDDDTKEILVLQFGGPCKQGYFSYQALAQVQKVLEAEGKFEGGKFYPHVAPGHQQAEAKDGFEALWEKKTGKKLVYPEGRYTNPIIMKLDAFKWRRVDDGVYRKTLGMFNEHELVADMLKVEKGGRIQLPTKANAVQLFYVSTGDGQANEHAIKAQSALRLKPGQNCVLSSQGNMELLRIELPSLDG